MARPILQGDSRTTSCWKTTSCQATSKPRSRPSSPTTTTADTTRASTISPRPTSTSDAALPSWQNEKGSNDTPSTIAACSIACTPPDPLIRCARASLILPKPVVSTTLTTDSVVSGEPEFYKAAFGSTQDEFEEILSRPHHMIFHRHWYERYDGRPE